MKTLAVIITSPPSNHLTQTAYQIVAQAHEQGVSVVGVFFYQSGVMNASKHLAIPNDEFPLVSKWSALSSAHNIPLYLCSTAAEKHGLIIENNPNSNELINEEFVIAGLGELVQLSSKANRTVQL